MLAEAKWDPNWKKKKRKDACETRFLGCGIPRARIFSPLALRDAAVAGLGLGPDPRSPSRPPPSRPPPSRPPPSRPLGSVQQAVERVGIVDRRHLDSRIVFVQAGIGEVIDADA